MDGTQAAVLRSSFSRRIWYLKVLYEQGGRYMDVPARSKLSLERIETGPVTYQNLQALS